MVTLTDYTYITFDFVLVRAYTYLCVVTRFVTICAPRPVVHLIPPSAARAHDDVNFRHVTGTSGGGDKRQVLTEALALMVEVAVF